MLILAGVSIKLAIDNNGVIENAKEAKDQYEQAQANDESGLEDFASKLKEQIDANKNNNSGSGSSESTVDGVPIPNGYYYVGGTKAKGIVISDNVADKELDKGKENVRRDLAGNQWVWVPVETQNSLYTTVAAGQKLAGSTGVKTTKYTNSEIISGKTRGLPGDTSSFREPDLVLGSDGTSYDYANYATAGFSSLANMKK